MKTWNSKDGHWTIETPQNDDNGYTLAIHDGSVAFVSIHRGKGTVWTSPNALVPLDVMAEALRQVGYTVEEPSP